MNSFKTNENFIFYLYFICERQRIFWKRLRGESYPWTEDEILRNNKFTNVYRVLDRSSQFLLSNVIYNEKGLANDYDTEDIFWRIMLYKHFNLPETWLAIEKEFGDITLKTGIDNVIKFLNDYTEQGNKLYSNAYMMTCPFMKNLAILNKWGLKGGEKKAEIYLKIYKKEVFEDKLMYVILKSKSFKELCDNLLKITGVAGFLAYQYAQDLNYSQLFNFDENTVCLAGPGTQRGIERTFDIEGTPNYEEIVKWIQVNFYQLLEDYRKQGYVLNFEPLPGREMKVPDFSNNFCETDKYMRGLGVETEGIKAGRIKQLYKQETIKSEIKFVFPPKWNVKELK